MRPLFLFLLGLAAYAVFLATGTPATAIAPRVEAATGGRVKIAAAMGTIVSGEATVDVRTPALGTLRIDALRWHWRPARLLAGEVAFDLEAQVAGLRLAGQGARSLGEWQLRGLKGGGDSAAWPSLLDGWLQFRGLGKAESAQKP